MNIKENLEYARKQLKEKRIDEYNLKSRLLLTYVLKQSKEYLIINQDKELSEKEQLKFNQLLEKLLNNVPIQYLTNKQEFYGIEFYVDENVLIPQPDTEILVEEVIQIAKKENKKKILDLCTGSGAIAIALEKNIENANIMATDISEKALEVAKKNDKEQKIKFIKSDMFENLQNETFDIIVSNPPYIKEHFIKELPKEVQKEPIIALNGGVDGLEHYKIIINNAKKYLKNNGYLCLEIGEDQKEEVLQLLEKHNYTGIYSKTDLAGNDRIIIAKVFTIKNF